MDNKLWLPTSQKEVDALGYDQLDVIIFSGDAYVDHPSFGAAVIGRTLQAHGYKVAIVPQPNWRDDLRDFKKLGRPRLYFGVSAGAMDSMVNHYTAARRLRSDDAYTPGGRHGMRPDYPTIVYSRILKELYPDVPVIAGGIEASMRRLSHYDYWQDKLRPSILADAPVDMLCYGMGEKTMLEIARRLDSGECISSITDVRQTALLRQAEECKNVASDSGIVLYSFDECLKDKIKQSSNFKHIEQQANKFDGGLTLWQRINEKQCVKVNPMFPPLETAEVDATFDLPYTRMPHPRYRGKRIPAYEMIRHSICMHRGCFGGCAFCTISAHQGKFIASRSKESILKEAEAVTRMPDFKGYISDLGGPSANMYAMGGKDKKKCEACLRPSCLHPKPCPNLDTSHKALIDIYQSVDKLPGVKKSFVGSGVRYDLAMHPTGSRETDLVNETYCRELITKHVSGRLKVAPEHTSDHVLNIMRKPSFSQFYRFKEKFDRVNSQCGLRQQLIPYFISSHPGCTEEDMAQLAADTRNVGMHLEQVQDFTPTPMTVSTEIYYTGYHPYTGEKIFCATTPEQKQAQRQFFFWYDAANRPAIIKSLNRIDRPDLIRRLFPGYSGTQNKQTSYNKKKQRRK
ncbi:MAG: YgiQ family radical SAM protein [Muribaculum sp.]|nr:YgiQ family radical SAM protein [Muribaculaceae bacterium]MCM1080847.1 YgiQ family radical SAM protein [Muribaculum sp.]